jgi:CO/xanthine dehydrogenase Mo-binding subunit
VDATELIEVDYDVLDAVVNVEKAALLDAPQLTFSSARITFVSDSTEALRNPLMLLLQKLLTKSV